VQRDHARPADPDPCEDLVCHGPRRRRADDRRERQIRVADELPHARDRLRTEDRVSSKREEVIGHAHAGYAEHGLPDRDQLVLEYQPVLDLGNETVVGFEALLRWHRPGFGIISPVDFIPVLEDESGWRTAAHYDKPDDAYILLVDRKGTVLWQTDGEPTNAAYARFKAELTQVLEAQSDRSPGAPSSAPPH